MSGRFSALKKASSLIARSVNFQEKKRPQSLQMVVRSVVEPLESRILFSTFTVTNLNDSGTGSLRAAITSADAVTNYNGIVFASGLTGTINLASALPGISDGVSIYGTGITINGHDHGSVLTISATKATSPLGVVIQGLTITGGSAAGIDNLGSETTIAQDTIIGNSNANGAGGGISGSTGLHSLFLVESTISGNTAKSGGGVYTSATQSNEIFNCTITGNSATLNGGGASGDLVVVDCTITANSAAAGGGIYTTNLDMGGTIVAANTGGDIALAAKGTLAGDHNLVGDGSDGGKFTASLRGTKASPLNPKLAALAYNGGTNDTMSLLAGSPAIGASINYSTGGGALENFEGNFDQREVTRPATADDIGAFEVGNAPNQLVFQVQPTDAVIGVPIKPAVVVYIENGLNQLVTTDNSNVTLSGIFGSFGVTLGGTVTVAAVKGVATFSNVFAGVVFTGDRLVASDGSDHQTISNTFNFTPSTPAQLAVVSGTPPNPTIAGTLIPKLVVDVEDAGGSLVANSTVAVSINTGTKTYTVNAVAGVATFTNVHYDIAGLVNVVATSPGLQNGETYFFTVTPSAAVHLTLTSTLTTVFAGENFNSGFNVVATDAFGNVRDGDPIILKIVSGPAGGVVTHQSGQPFLFTKLNKLGKYTLEGTEGALISNVSSTITVVSDPSYYNAVFVVQPGNTVAGKAINPAVVVDLEDAGGNIITGRGGQLQIYLKSYQPAMWNANIVAGVATFNNVVWGVAGTYILETSEYIASEFITVPYDSKSFTVAPGPVAHLAFVQNPTNIVAGSNISPAITVLVKDAFGFAGTGNLLTGVTVKLSIETGPVGGLLSGTITAISNASGIATFTGVTLPLAGSYTLVASVGAVVSTASSTFKVSAAVVAHLAFVQNPTNVIAGINDSPAITVKATDSLGHAVDGVTVKLAIGSGPVGGALVGTITAITNAAGIATFSGISFHIAGSYTLTASDGAIVSPKSASFTVSHAAIAHLAFVQNPTNAVAGVNIAPGITVKATDAFGNIISGASVKLAIGSGPFGGALFGTVTAITAATGIATFSTVSFHIAGAYTLTASDGAIVSPKSIAFTISAAKAGKLIFTTLPVGAKHGVVFTVKVSVEDAFGNVLIADNTGTITLALATHPTGSTLVGTLTANVVKGVASFSNLLVNLAGSYSLKASDSFAIAAITSAAFAVG